ncbi:MAG: hypothetical protein MRY79_08305 [Alphaproteobacteria bacterium]|nr:hypothetical protein [Alphaproteobacteria bacterium]
MTIGTIGTVRDAIEDFREVWKYAVARGKFEGSLEEYIKKSDFSRYFVRFAEPLKISLGGNLSGAGISDELFQQANLQVGDEVAVEVDCPKDTAKVTKVIKLG